MGDDRTVTGNDHEIGSTLPRRGSVPISVAMLHLRETDIWRGCNGFNRFFEANFGISNFPNYFASRKRLRIVQIYLD